MKIQFTSAIAIATNLKSITSQQVQTNERKKLSRNFFENFSFLIFSLTINKEMNFCLE